MGTHLRVLSEGFPMNTNMPGFRWFSIHFCIVVLWKKVASALEGLSSTLLTLVRVVQLILIPNSSDEVNTFLVQIENFPTNV